MGKVVILTICALLIGGVVLFLAIHLTYLLSCYFSADRIHARKVKREADDALFDLECAAKRAQKAKKK